MTPKTNKAYFDNNFNSIFRDIPPDSMYTFKQTDDGQYIIYERNVEFMRCSHVLLMDVHKTVDALNRANN